LIGATLRFMSSHCQHEIKHGLGLLLINHRIFLNEKLLYVFES
jgi:hypothetical protein